jgi:hypothetical protein
MTEGTDRREVLEVGPPPARNRWVLLGLVGAVVLMLIGFTVTNGRPEDLLVPPSTPSPTPSAPSTTGPTTPTTSPSPPPGPRVVRNGSGPLAPGVPRGSLYVRTDDSVYVVDPATGRVVRTDGAAVDSTGPVALVPTATGVVIRPIDTVFGLLVDDGRKPTPLRGALRQAEQVLPGPGGRIWASRSDRRNSYTLVDAAGRAAGPTITTSGWFRSDGGTGLLLEDVSGVWQAYPGRMRRITIGAVVAVGPRHYQLTECDDAHRCSDYLLDRSTGKRRPLGPASEVGVQNGVISPGGTYSALVQASADGTYYIRVGRLKDGTIVRGFRGPGDGFNGVDLAAVWLSDRWLAVLEGGRLSLYDPSRKLLVSPGFPLTGAIQLAWRPA